MTDGSSLTFSVGKIALPPFVQPTPCSHSRLLERRQAASIAKRANSTVGTRRLAASIAKRTNSTVGMRRLAASISKTLPPRRRLACYALGDKVPDTAAAAFVAPSASIIGAVDVADDASVWYNCTIRGDVHGTDDRRAGRDESCGGGVGHLISERVARKAASRQRARCDRCEAPRRRQLAF